jgi:single-stranded DNA-binding protein
MLNVVALVGVLTRPAQDRVLPSGTRLLSLEVTVKPDQGAAETVPVAWFDAPAWATALQDGDGVVVVGRVRRRVFRARGTTQSRTEVLATRVARASPRGRARYLLAEAAEAIDAAAEQQGG